MHKTVKGREGNSNMYETCLRKKKYIYMIKT